MKIHLHERHLLFGLLAILAAMVLLCVCLLGTRRRMTPEEFLGYATERGDIATVVSLLDGGTSVHTRCQEGSSEEFWCLPIHIAARRGDVALVRVLLDRGADPNSRDNRDETPIMRIVVYRRRPGHYDCIELLLERGADINAQEPRMGETALHIASSNNDLALAKFLLDHGADPNIKDVHGAPATNPTRVIPP